LDTAALSGIATSSFVALAGLLDFFAISWLLWR
jgi:hypothetical protein